jgi:hypothetical protein
MRIRADGVGYGHAMGGDGRFLRIYLNDHLAGATAGSELARRMARTQPGELAAELTRLDAEIAEDRAELLRLMADLGVAPRRYKIAAGWLAEKVGRLKANGRLASRSPLSTLLELETLQIGVEGKAAGWEALQSALKDPPHTARLDRLRTRAEEQARTLAELHRSAAATVLACDPVMGRRAG